MAFARDPITVIGVTASKASASQFGRQLEASIAEVVNETLEEIVVAAKEIVPKDTRSLERSIRVEKKAKRSRSEKTIIGSVQAGGASSPNFVNYANKIHEEHPTGSKYIQRPAFEISQRLPQRFRRSFSRLRSTGTKAI